MRLAAALLFAASSLALAPARAEDPPLIAVVEGADTALVQRICAELAALGFQVTTVAGDASSPSREHLEGVAKNSGAAAAVRLAPSSMGIEVWVVDRVTGKTVLREVLDRDASSVDAGADADAVVAVRTVELLRASLLEVDLPHPSRGDVQPTRALRRAARLPAKPAPVDPPRLSPSGDAIALGAGVGASVSPGGLGPSPAVVFGAHWRPAGRIAAGITSLLPTLPARVTSIEGTADISTTFFGAGLRLDLLGSEAALRPTLGAGISVLWFHMEGTGIKPRYIGRSDDIVTAGPYAELGLEYRVQRALSLRSELRIAAAFPEPVIAFAGRTVATMGRPFAALSLGIERTWR